ncbi:MAG: AMP-binding protein, partial [Kiritimatiellaeota bacterium]|nr:AMP-binding protein [Kiritimatiellota bacterium]
APCDAALLRAFAHLDLPMLEGYGLTETSPVLTLNPLERPKPGTVGPALPNVELRLFDVNAEGIGEIAARGPNVMRGYYNQPEATAAAFRDGWFLTGDLGKFDAHGYLTITGRKKCLIVNREGKNINPEEVEAQALKSPLIKEALALGYRESGERVGEHVGLIVVPRDELLSDADAEQKIRADLKRVLHAIADYKHPRHIVIRREEFEKTATAKIKRFRYTMPA